MEKRRPKKRQKRINKKCITANVWLETQGVLLPT
jgi:hypothetical protein